VEADRIVTDCGLITRGQCPAQVDMGFMLAGQRGRAPLRHVIA
jgi:hypothetical protein